MTNRHEPDQREKVKRDFERWDWNDLHAEGFLNFVILRRMLNYGVPIALLFFLVTAWLEKIPLADVISGRKPGLGFLAQKFLLILGVFLVTAAAFGVHEWHSRERKRKNDDPAQQRFKPPME